MRRETVAGTALLRRPGSANLPPLVLLHGIGSDAASWEPVLRTLDPRIEAIAWDAPGYGTSTPLIQNAPRPADYAARLEAILNELSLPRVVLVGHSLGALFAASFAASQPQRIAALALCSPALGYRVPEGASLPPAVQVRIDDLNRLGPAAFATMRAARLVYQPDTKPDVLAGVTRTMAAVHPAGYAQAVRALGAGDLLADAAHIDAPTLVAVGAQDVVTPPPNAQAAFAALPRGLRLVEVPDTGHALPQEAPAIVAALLKDLVEAFA